MTNQAFFGDPPEVQSSTVGDTFTLRGAEAHHAATVKRVVPGETVDVVDGDGHRLGCTVVDASSAAVLLTVDRISFEPLPETRLVLVQALAKGDRAELAVEAATELGIDAVLPWQADRSVVRWRAEKVLKGRAKWESIVRAASKQSRRARLPEVLEPRDTRAVARWLEDMQHCVLLHEDGQETLAGYWSRNRTRARGSLALIVGPEGGVSPQEVALFMEHGAAPVRLGSNVLRASTAGPAAVAVLNQMTGRW